MHAQHRSTCLTGGAVPQRRLLAARRRRPVGRAVHALPVEFGSEVLLAALSTYPEFAADTFEPQLQPEILIAAGFAATPPILFWARIFSANQRRLREIAEAQAAEEQRQQEREELKRKITGQWNEPPAS